MSNDLNSLLPPAFHLPDGQANQLNSSFANALPLPEIPPATYFPIWMDEMFGVSELVGGRRAIPTGMAHMVSIKPTGTVSIRTVTSTGFVAIQWWDGSIVTYAATASTYTYNQKTVPTTGNWSKSAPKEIFIWPCISLTDASFSGNLTLLYCNGNYLTSLDVSECGALEVIYAGQGYLRTLDVRNCVALKTLSCGGNLLTKIDVSKCPNLNSLFVDSNALNSLEVSTCTDLRSFSCCANQIKSLDLLNCTKLSSLACSENQLTSLCVTGLTAMYALYCDNNNLTSLDLSGCVNLSGVFAYENRLQSVRCLGIGRVGYTSDTSYNFYGNLLSEAALNMMFQDLADDKSEPGTMIDISQNPGSLTCNTAIATAKGYIIFK
jgi:Leucine-rich repeat (LRR) protein